LDAHRLWKPKAWPKPRPVCNVVPRRGPCGPSTRTRPRQPLAVQTQPPHRPRVPSWRKPCEREIRVCPYEGCQARSGEPVMARGCHIGLAGWLDKAHVASERCAGSREVVKRKCPWVPTMPFPLVEMLAPCCRRHKGRCPSQGHSGCTSRIMNPECASTIHMVCLTLPWVSEQHIDYWFLHHTHARPMELGSTTVGNTQYSQQPWLLRHHPHQSEEGGDERVAMECASTRHWTCSNNKFTGGIFYHV
jgi:hypothetical protein